MKVISTAQIISQAFKNAGRVREITSVLVSHGFAELIHRMRLSRFLPHRTTKIDAPPELSTETRLRLCFEKLGPTFVKLGQVLATRPDLIPESFVEEFQKLQDSVASVPYSQIQTLIESELHCGISEVFQSFDEIPMAAASIAQAHGAVLKSGERVAIKVQRPEIEKTIKNDISILQGLAVLMEKYIPESQIFNPKGIVDEFFKTISLELDFKVEANNMRRIRQNLAEIRKVAIPVVYSQYSTGRMLVMERFDGIRLSNLSKIRESKIDPSEVVEIGCNAFFQMVMHDGIFHGDIHAGNLFILEDGRLGLIDFGMVGRLSRPVRESVITMFLALMNEDYESLALEYLNLSRIDGSCDILHLQKDLMDLISPYMGMSLGEVDIGKILLRTTTIAAKHHLRVPRELMLLFKAMVTIEALGKQLDPHFDLLAIGTRLAKKSLSSRYSKDQIIKDLIVVGREVQYLIENFPKIFKQSLRRWVQNDFVFETKNKDIRALATATETLTYYAVVATLGVCLTATGLTLVILDKGHPIAGLSLPGVACLGSAFFILLHSAWTLRKK